MSSSISMIPVQPAPKNPIPFLNRFSASATPSPDQHCSPNKQRFEELWFVQSSFQRGMLCALGVSPSGRWLASSSLDCNIIFIDFKSGQLVGVLDFESRFHVMSILWLSESLVHVGTSNGACLAINFNPGAEHPIAMRPIMSPFNSPVTALALDPTRGFLAVGSAGDTFIYSQPAFGDVESSWDLVDHIPAPSAELQGLVMSLAFYTTSAKDSHLFIGYAKEGFCIWRGPHNYQRTPYNANDTKGAVCTIGSAAVSAEGRFIAIVTLDHAIVLYPLTHKGPAIHEQQVFQSQEEPGPLVIVPVALTPGNLLFKGTASGTVPIVDLKNGPLEPIRSSPTEVIRTLTTCADKVVIGFSPPAGQGSQIKCYRDLTASTGVNPWSPADTNRPVFEIAIGDLEERSGSYRTLDGLGFRGFYHVFKSLFVHTFGRLVAVLQSRQTWTRIGMIWILFTILVVDPPQLPGHANVAHDEPVFNTPQEYSTDLTTSSDATEYPTLAFLFSYCGSFVASRFMWWGSWCLACGVYLLAAAFKVFLWVATVVPHTICLMVTVLPTFLSAAVCEVLLTFGDVPFCPKRSN